MPWDEPERNITFNVDSADLSSHQKNLLLNLLEENKDVFASNINDLQKPCSIGEHQIILTEDNINPIRLNQYRKSIEENKVVDEEINRLLGANIIRPSNSPWSFPVLLVPKSNGKKRMCVDYRQIKHVNCDRSLSFASNRRHFG